MTKTSPIYDKRKEIGVSVRKRRVQLGLLQKELAEKVGTSQRNISDIEKGKINFSIDKLISIYKALKIDF